MPITLDEVQSLVDQLSPDDKRHLWDRLSAQLAQLQSPPGGQPAARQEAWGQWDALREEFRAIRPVSPTAGEQLDWDRQARDAVLMGLAGAGDVHP